MAKQEHLDILKQGVDVWNLYREKHPDILPDFSRAEMSMENLNDANLRGANLKSADLKWTDLIRANISRANLEQANLNGANLNGANLSRTNLSWTNLSRANLCRANLSRAVLNKTIFNQAYLQWTIFGHVDLSLALELDTVKHLGPSIVGIDVIYSSESKIPEVFLRGAGIPDEFIAYAHSLTGKRIKHITCFISYASHDQIFAEQLYIDLQSNGVRCWFAPEDLKWGNKIRPSLDEAISDSDRLLLVLSQHSLGSQWVEQEVETALEKERKRQSTVLFPIRLDNAVMEMKSGWPALIRNTRTIGDFTQWKQNDAYQLAFERLLRDLKAESEKDGESGR